MLGSIRFFSLQLNSFFSCLCLSDKFAINALTGEITVKAELSAEIRTDYVLNITAEDQKGTGSNVLSSSVSSLDLHLCVLSSDL